MNCDDPPAMLESNLTNRVTSRSSARRIFFCVSISQQTIFVDLKKVSYN